MSAPLVTISAAWGTGGSRIGPRVAERIGLAFGDRAPLDLAASAATRGGSHAG